MFRAIGTVIVLFAIVQLFNSATTAFESALVATFNTIEVAAEVSEQQLQARAQ